MWKANIFSNKQFPQLFNRWKHFEHSTTITENAKKFATEAFQTSTTHHVLHVRSTPLFHHTWSLIIYAWWKTESHCHNLNAHPNSHALPFKHPHQKWVEALLRSEGGRVCVCGGGRGVGGGGLHTICSHNSRVDKKSKKSYSLFPLSIPAQFGSSFPRNTRPTLQTAATSLPVLTSLM